MAALYFSSFINGLPIMLYFAIIIVVAFCTAVVDATILYNDGQTHIQNTSLNDSIILRSSSTLILGVEDYTIRSPSGAECAIRLYMSSSINATGGDVIGGDASLDHLTAGVGIIVGSASTAVFNEGVTVRGGNHVGLVIEESSRSNDKVKGTPNSNSQGGDAVIAQYFGSNVTIRGGKFIGGSGSMKDGHSLQSTYEAQINVSGGTYYGSWLLSNRGIIVVTGCVNRIGTRLVGRLQSGQSIDVQLIEETGGKVIIHHPSKCNDQYRKKDASSVPPRFLIRSICCTSFIMILLLM